MMIDPVDMPQPRRLLRFWRIVREGLPVAGRYKRYVLSMAPVLIGIFGTTGAYLVLMPYRYQSEFSLILPGSGMGSSLNLESIGQAQTSASSAFSSPTLSPTENYKQLLSADVTLRAAAQRVHEDGDSFPAPTIKLIDQTNLILVSISGKSPHEAQGRADALRQAFLAQLDILRADEAAKREASDVKHLQELSDKVRAAQRRLIAFQASHGLATLDQFNARITAVDTLREKERETRLQLRQFAGMSGRLAVNLRTSPRDADAAMRLRGDPLFQQLVERYAVLNAQANEKSGTLGPQHAAMAQVQSERAAIAAALITRGHQLSGLSEAAILSSADLQVSDGRTNLMQTMAVNDAQAAGEQPPSYGIGMIAAQQRPG